MPRGAIVVGAHVNGLGVIRALGARGVPIVAVTSRPFDMAQHSRWVTEVHHLDDMHERPETLIDLLDRHRERWTGWGVFPTNDTALTVLAQHHASLSTTYRPIVQPWPTASRFVDKALLHELATEIGLDLPRCYGPATLDVAEDPEIRFPVAVKPRQHDRLISRFGVKLFLARNRQELRDAVARLATAEVDGLIFDFVPGPDSNILVYAVYVSPTGEPSPGVTIRKLRQYPAAIGAACAARIVPDIPELRTATLALVDRVRFRGMAFAEFKHEPGTNRYRFIEINGRAVLFNSLPQRAGLDLVNMAWDDFVLGAPVRAGLPTGGWPTWIHVAADVRASLDRHPRPGLVELVAPYFRHARDAVWSWSDPRPFLAQAAQVVRRGGVRS